MHALCRECGIALPQALRPRTTMRYGLSRRVPRTDIRHVRQSACLWAGAG